MVKVRFPAQLALGSTLLVVVTVSLLGCASLETAPQRRELTMENSWTRSTTQKEFLGFRRLNRMSPLLNEGLIIQGNSIDGIVAYEQNTGRQIWRLNLENGVEGGAEVAGDKLYFGSSNGQFYCVQAATGKIVWTFPVRAETLAPPTVENGIVYFQSGADVIYALDAETGKQLWLYNRQVTGNLSIRATTKPVIAGEWLLAGFSDGFVVALRKRDGNLNWERKLGRGNRFRDVDSTPVIDGENAFVASYDGSLVSLRVDSGEVNWSIEQGAYVPVTVGQGPLSDRLYYATADGKILFLDKNSGKQTGQIELRHGIATQPSIYKGFIVYGESEGALVLADAGSGQAVSRFDSGLGLMARPTVVEKTGEAYFISNSANLYALKLKYQEPLKRIPGQTEL